MRTSFLLLSIVSLTIACAPHIDPNPPNVLIEPGLKAFPTPRTTDGVGTVTRVDKDGVSHLFTTLTLVPPATLNPEMLPQYTMNDTVGAALVLNFLKNLSGNPNIGGAVGRTIALSFSATGTKREISDDLTLRKALVPILPMLDFSKGDRYYVISETILADSINYTVARTQLDSIGGSANLAKVIGGKIDIREGGNSNYILTARLSPPHRIFYKTEEITPRKGGGITISSLPMTGLDRVKLVKDESHSPLIRDW